MLWTQSILVIGMQRTFSSEITLYNRHLPVLSVSAATSVDTGCATSLKTSSLTVFAHGAENTVHIERMMVDHH